MEGMLVFGRFASGCFASNWLLVRFRFWAASRWDRQDSISLTAVSADLWSSFGGIEYLFRSKGGSMSKRVTRTKSCRGRQKLGVLRVRDHRKIEERILRLLDRYEASPETDKRWLDIGRSCIEQGFMAINRAVFEQKRAELPED